MRKYVCPFFLRWKDVRVYFRKWKRKRRPPYMMVECWWCFSRSFFSVTHENCRFAWLRTTHLVYGWPNWSRRNEKFSHENDEDEVKTDEHHDRSWHRQKSTWKCKLVRKYHRKIDLLIKLKEIEWKFHNQMRIDNLFRAFLLTYFV